MSSKIAIDGFRRTGRSLFRAALYYPDLEVVALNALSEAPTRGDTGEFESHEYRDRQEGRRLMSASHSDALVLFGVTGDLAHKMIFPALYAMAKRGVLKVPIIAVAFAKWSLERLRKRVTDSIKRADEIDDQRALHHLLSLIKYLGSARRPAHYLAFGRACARHCRNLTAASHMFSFLSLVEPGVRARSLHNPRRAPSVRPDLLESFLAEFTQAVILFNFPTFSPITAYLDPVWVPGT